MIQLTNQHGVKVFVDPHQITYTNAYTEDALSFVGLVGGNGLIVAESVGDILYLRAAWKLREDHPHEIGEEPISVRLSHACGHEFTYVAVQA
jgi:uncharacterized protein YlzI (FlbEa/FlbD family)